MIAEEVLLNLYNVNKFSMQEIAIKLGHSSHKVCYWMDKYGIKRRTISDAVYTRSNPLGDPFRVVPIKTQEQARLMGMGLGLYWGEGNKANIYSVRLGNTDPELIKTFILFLEELFAIDTSKLRFSLQIFSDTTPETAISYWQSKIGFSMKQLGKVIVTKSGSIGTYRNKNMFGVMTVYFHNKKLRDIIVGLLPR